MRRLQRVPQRFDISTRVKSLEKGTAKMRPQRFEHRDGATLGVALHRCTKRHHIGSLFDALLLRFESEDSL